VPENAEVLLGVDVSRSVAGDQNCVAQVRGGRLERLTLWRSPDLMETTRKVIEQVAMSGATRVRVDATGVGAGCADRLKQMGRNVDAVLVGSAARDASRFVNLRAEMHWRCGSGWSGARWRCCPTRNCSRT